MPDFIFSEYVEPELDAIWQYIAIDNPDAADRFIEAAFITFEELARMPAMGRKREFAQARLRDLRSFRIRDFDNLLIFYAPIPNGIEVFHVIHGARDISRFFQDE